ncbi:MAG: hypothetical protein A2X28_05990 [Elusimicrobia bacterium GWA2_56_46]|nr:MAG: hypothetical protein A2X28_05990 [Elusimicrobia bacterium GWA2_56_46]OGR54582.1 MAG: hypothetical protein A2X39_02040 [Elusimicrobia bacterium GWC2_56_31]HBB65746.1 hypothetical protein [Elusimicrobiota bacterium]HBW23936.1 hypothetical protein [Elusimicrobiota bacterium]
MTQSLSHKIVKNTLFNAIGRFWGILVAVVLTPYIISRIGLDRYGIWTLVGVATSYFGLLDLGIGTSFVKYISEFHAKGDREKINRLINTGVIFYSLFAVLLIGLGVGFIEPLLSILKIPRRLHDEAAIVFLMGIVLFAMSNIVSVFGAIQGALQRMDISNKLSLVFSIPAVIGTVLFLKYGFGLVGLMANNFIVLMLSSLANILIAFRLFPELKLSPFLFDKEMLRRLIGFGYKLQLSNITNIFAFQSDKVIIAYFLNVELVSLYQLGKTVVDKARELPLLLVSAIVPAASEISANGDDRKLRELYTRGMRYLALTGIPLLVFVFFTAPLIMSAWIGPGCDKAVLVIRLLVPAYMANYLTGMGSAMALGMGKPQFQLKASLVNLFVGLPLSILLAVNFGFTGIVFATFVSLSTGSLYFLVLFHRHLNYSLAELVRKAVVRPAVVSSLLGAAVFLTNAALFAGPSGRMVYLGVLSAEAFVFFAGYAAALTAGGYLDAYDKELIREKISGIKRTAFSG